MPRRSGQRLAIVSSLAAIPAFATEDEEADYWATHTLAPHLLDQMRALSEDEAPRLPRTRALSLRLVDVDAARKIDQQDAAGRRYLFGSGGVNVSVRARAAAGS